MYYYTTDKGFRISKDGFSADEIVHEYTEEQHARLFSLSDGESIGTDYSGRLFVQSPDIEVVIQIKAEEVNTIRKQYEYGGVTINGVQYGTSDKDKMRLDSIIDTFLSGVFPYENVQWKTSNGHYISLTLEWSKTVSSIIMQHYIKCFAEEQRIQGEIKNLSSIQEVLDYPIIFNI